jgi:hypothetical protein
MKEHCTHKYHYIRRLVRFHLVAIIYNILNLPSEMRQSKNEELQTTQNDW